MNKEEKEEYPGDVSSYEGKIPVWLLVVFAALIVWAIYYFVENWGGFGPAYQTRQFQGGSYAEKVGYYFGSARCSSR